MAKIRRHEAPFVEDMIDASVPDNKKMKTSEILDYFDSKVGYKSIGSDDHVVMAPTWRTWRSRYNSTHPSTAIANQSTQKTSGACYFGVDVKFMYRLKEKVIKQLWIEKTYNPVESLGFDRYKYRYSIAERNANAKAWDNADNDADKQALDDIKNNMLAMLDLDMVLDDIHVARASAVDDPAYSRSVDKLQNPWRYLRPDIVDKIKNEH